MSFRNEISPDTLPIELDPEGIDVRYHDDRSVFYHGVPTKTTEAVSPPPGTQVQVLITDRSHTEGVMIYVNDRKTADEILESSGVGRVLVDNGEETTLFPGVTASASNYRETITADPGVAEGRVFVFAEDEMQEHSWEIVAEE